MNAKHVAILAAATTIALLSTAAATFAQPGVATGSVNVRTGPGIGYARIAALPAGEYVDVGQCQGAWCYVDRYAGLDGWVSANYLAPVAAHPAAGMPQMPFNFGISVGPVSPSFALNFGTIGLPGPITPEVCFFKGSNYSGATSCVTAGSAAPTMPTGWDDAISSMTVDNGAEITFCRHPWYGGACTTIATSQPSLGVYDDAISSFKAQ